jgi:hypothetical protein
LDDFSGMKCQCHVISHTSLNGTTHVTWKAQTSSFKSVGPDAEQRRLHTAKQGFVMQMVTSLDDSPVRET